MKKLTAALAALKASITQLNKLEKQLTKAGCMKAYVHFKTNSNKMYLNEPVDPRTGKRPFHYIGVDPVKQQAARDKIARFELREQIRRERADLQREYTTLQQDLQDLTEHAAVVARHSTKAVKDFEKGYFSSAPAGQACHPRGKGLQIPAAAGSAM